MLETPKALDTIIIKIKTKHKQKTKFKNKKQTKIFVFLFLLVKILKDVTMDNQQETKKFILFKLIIKQENKKQLFNYIILPLILTVFRIQE